MNNTNSDIPIFEKKNVIVTGGSGFIGSHLCERLLREAKVICIDDLSHSNIRNVEHLLQYPDFEFINYDVSKPIDLDHFEELDKFRVKYQGVQEIYHLACPTSKKNFEDLKLQSLWANSRAMLSTLDLAVKYRAKYVFTSSSVVYGPADSADQLMTESHKGIVDHLSPRACYDEGKRFAETCVATYNQVHNIDAKIARVFTTYGPRMKLRDGLVVPDFIVSALEGKPLEIYGDGSATESFCYVTDLIDGLVRLMHSGPKTKIINIGTEQMLSAKELAERIIDMSGSSSEIAYQGELAHLTKKGMPDIAVAKEQLGWLPLVRLEDGLKKTIDFTIANKEAMLFQ